MTYLLNQQAIWGKAFRFLPAIPIAMDGCDGVVVVAGLVEDGLPGLVPIEGDQLRRFVLPCVSSGTRCRFLHLLHRRRSDDSTNFPDASELFLHPGAATGSDFVAKLL